MARVTKMKQRKRMSGLTVERFVKHYGSKFRGLIGRDPDPLPWTEDEARAFFTKYSRRIWSRIEQQGRGHEPLENWIVEAFGAEAKRKGKGTEK